MARKKSSKKRTRTRILVIVPMGAPEWVSEEFSRILTGLPPNAHCIADTVNFDDVDITSIELSKPDWILVYCPVNEQEWICSLLRWIVDHPEIHIHILYEKNRESSKAPPIRKPSDPFQEPDYVLRDFCLGLTPPKRPS